MSTPVPEKEAREKMPLLTKIKAEPGENTPERELPHRSFQKTIPRELLYWFLTIFTAGIFFFIARWLPQFKAYVRYRSCRNQVATHVLVKKVEEGVTWWDLIDVIEDVHFRFFEYKCLRYVYHPDDDRFLYQTYDVCLPFNKIHELSNGLDDSTVAQRLSMFGPNLLDVPVPSYPSLVISEALHPFYIFQVASAAIWYSDEYYIYATCIVVMAILAIAWTVYQTKQNMINLHEMATHHSTVRVIRNQEEEPKPSTDLVPGDIILISADMEVPTDCILLKGQCVVDETMLTGESVPVVKSSLPKESDAYNPKVHSQHTLFQGTKVLQAKSPRNTNVMAVVSTTGFSSTKGLLVRFILFPKPTNFKFYRDSLRFILLLGLFAMIGFVYAAWQFVKLGASPFQVFIRAADLITIIVPPALPIAMTMGIAFAMARLKTKSIFCISPPRVNVAGRIDLICFDKTGTLTESGLRVLGSQFSDDGQLEDFCENVTQTPKPLIYVLSCCHSISKLKSQLTGDPLDINMFEATKWDLLEDENGSQSPNEDSLNMIVTSQQETFEIIKRFEFSSLLQRMTVIALNRDRKHVWVFVKGSPEKIRDLCNLNSVPNRFDEQLEAYTYQGYRVIACAGLLLSGISPEDACQIPRNELESELNFLGFLVMENPLKKDTKEVIQFLNNAVIKTVMVTGDNIYTAIHVGRSCQLVPDDQMMFICDPRDRGLEFNFVPSSPGDHNALQFSLTDSQMSLAMTGTTFSHLRDNDPEEFQRLLRKSLVFARMSPFQKAQLVAFYQDLGFTVSMTGDGANDCGALITADVGLSLSEAEASVAAHFTSKRPSIYSVHTLLREGRCALTTSAQLFKYMACYSIIQFASVLILYTAGTLLADYQFLWIDLFIIVPLSFLMGLTRPKPNLSKQKPPASLLSPKILVSILVVLLLNIGFQASAFIMLKYQKWYVPVQSRPDYDPDSSDVRECQETTVIFLFSNFQYLMTIVIFTIDKHFRQPLFRNYPLLLALVVLVAANTYLLLYPALWLEKIFELVPIPMAFRLRLLILSVANFVLVWIYERFVVVYLLGKFDD